MKNIGDFVFLGFDLRERKSDIYTIDAIEWEQPEEYSTLLNSGQCVENSTQFLECPVSFIENCSNKHIVSAAFAISTSGYHLMKSLYSIYIENEKSPVFLLHRGWRFIGYDVADTDGYFSVFGIDRGTYKLPIPEKLFQCAKTASGLIEPANLLYPSHAPFSLFAVFIYGNKTNL